MRKTELLTIINKNIAVIHGLLPSTRGGIQTNALPHWITLKQISGETEKTGEREIVTATAVFFSFSPFFLFDSLASKECLNEKE